MHIGVQRNHVSRADGRPAQRAGEVTFPIRLFFSSHFCNFMLEYAYLLQRRIYTMGCLYWILIGWWYEPIKLLFRFLKGLTIGLTKIILSIVMFSIIAAVLIAFAGAGFAAVILIAVILFILKQILGGKKKY